MTVRRNKCFLCLNDVNVDNEGDTGSYLKTKKKNRNLLPKDTGDNELNPRILLLLKYLLTRKDEQCTELIDDIKGLLETNTNGKVKDEIQGRCFTDDVRFCAGCDSQTRTISELHQQLEVVQMKLVHVLKLVQNTIIQKVTTRDSEVIFRREDHQDSTAQKKTFEEIQTAFHEGVIKNAGDDSIQIPRVFLEKITYFKPTHSDIIIKTENEVDLNDNFHDFVPSPSEHAEDQTTWFETCQEPPKSNRRRKRRGPDLKIKDEAVDSPPKKSRRSASLLASVRMAAAKQKILKKIKKEDSSTDPGEKSQKPIKRPCIPRQFQLQSDSDRKRYKRPDQYWACATCSFLTKYQFKYEHHLRTHENETPPEDSTPPPYRCEECLSDVTFFVKQNYQYHQACHKGQIIHICEICKVYCQPLTFVEHMKTHSLEKIFPCPNCSYCCSTRESYLTHLAFHYKKAKHKCDICLSNFTIRALLLAHYYKEHQIGEKYECDVDGCKGGPFFDNSGLESHKKLYHGSSTKQKWVCQFCGRSYSCEQSFKAHLLRHSNVKPYSCEKCSDSFFTKDALKRHLIKKHDVAKEKCEYCGKEYTTLFRLNCHLAQVHTGGTDLVCEFPQCGKRFGRRDHLKRHQLMHSNERNFSCAECGATFKSKQCLKGHTKIHFGEKKFKCEYCEKAFLRAEFLKSHLNTHTGEKPFVCEECGKAFAQAGTLCNHKRLCHLAPESERATIKCTEVEQGKEIS